jgi:hypothetical protein
MRFVGAVSGMKVGEDRLHRPDDQIGLDEDQMQVRLAAALPIQLTFAT